MTDKEKIAAVQTIYSNAIKLRVAQELLVQKNSSANELSKLLGLSANYVTTILKAMVKAGTAESLGRDSYYVQYALTDLGKKLLKAI
ncbi:hypothetical protein [Dyadobacter sandarakinus]|uniref:Uncharacterized protein n=1 Tax=Dyadobacter sandarakinus TaxID=2747268 RepID=A0ABX7I1F3_9BACT|nr:hypothetical protein [Dyadobacter sandarakinus]QRQ99692.1 hypothetical protein HWI92_01565 [Dyadobacter sandarakinus]